MTFIHHPVQYKSTYVYCMCVRTVCVIYGRVFMNNLLILVLLRERLPILDFLKSVLVGLQTCLWRKATKLLELNRQRRRR